MKFQKSIALALLILAALACANVGSGSDPGNPIPSEGSTLPTETLPAQGNNPAPTGENASSPEETPTQEEPSGPADDPDTSTGTPPGVLNLDDPALYLQPEGLESYRTTLDYTFEAPGPIAGSVHMESATQVDPFATTLEFFTGGRAVMGNNEVFTFTQILDTQYIVYSGFGCQSGAPGVQENLFAVMLDTGGMLTGEAQFLGEETVNGVAVYAYTLTMDHINPNDPAGADVVSLSEGQIYLAKDGSYVVRVRLVGTGQSEVLSGEPAPVGEIAYELNFLDFNQPVEVQIPPGCPSGEEGADSKYPVPDDAANLTDLGGMTGFNTGLDVNTTIEFYKTEMAALGCGVPQELGAPPALSLTFACPTATVNVLLAAGDSGGTAVTIFETP